MSSESSWVWPAIVAAAAILGVFGWIVWQKGRPFAAGDVFRASRLSAGNHLFPTQVLISPTSVVQYTPRWIGKAGRVDSHGARRVGEDRHRLMLSNVLIETTGGASPIRCHGHHKGDAVRMKALIERYQNEYYRGGGHPPSAS